MEKRLVTLAVATALALCLLSVNAFVPFRVFAGRARYPGAAAVASKAVELETSHWGALRWQVTYLSPDDLSSVKAWYLEHLGIAIASEQNLSVVDNCAWLNQVKSLVLMSHATSVLVCATVDGTRITVSETVRSGP